MATPKILHVNAENGTEELRDMNNSESVDYQSALDASLNVIDKKQQAISKLYSLGLTEEDIKAVMS